MPKKPKALDLAGWRKSQMVTTKNGTRSMSQAEFGRLLGVGKSLICRIESGERWPTVPMWRRICDGLAAHYGAWGPDLIATQVAQLATWRAYSPDRKGKTP